MASLDFGCCGGNIRSVQPILHTLVCVWVDIFKAEKELEAFIKNQQIGRDCGEVWG